MFVVIDIGGTKTEIGIFKNQELSSRVFSMVYPTPHKYSTAKKKIVDEIKQFVKDIAKIQTISISFPGEVNFDNTILQASNLPDYKSKPLALDLEKVFNTKVTILQDATCSAISEVIYGDISKYSKVVYLILGTGVGGSLIEKRPIQTSPRQISQTSISPFEPLGMIVALENAIPHVSTGFDGILESYIGGGNIQDYFKIDLSKLEDYDVFWNKFIDYLTIGLNNINTVLKPDAIVIDGGIGQKRRSVFKNLEKKLKNYDDYMKTTPKILFSSINGNTALIGALASNFVEHLVINV